MIAPLLKKTINPSFAAGLFRFVIVAILTCFVNFLAGSGTLLAQSLKTPLPNQTVACSSGSTVTLTASAEHPNKNLVVQWQTLSNGNWVNVNTSPAVTYTGDKPVLATSTLSITNFTDKQAFRVFFGVNSIDLAKDPVTSTTIIIPSASFTVPTELLAGSNINLTFTGSASTNAKYQWTISDGTGAPAIQNPVLNFNAPGEKTITLTLTDGACTVTSVNKIRVNGTYIWNGTQSVNWHDPANWTPNLVPNAADNVLINTAPYLPVVSANTSINNLTLNTEAVELGTSTLTVLGNATINGGSFNGGTTAFAGNILATGNAPVNISNAVMIGSALQTISKSGNASPVFTNLAFNKTENKVNLETNLTVNGTLNLNNTNNLQLGNANLLIGPMGNIIAGPAGYVVTNGLGSLQMTVANNETEVFFPVGNHSYNPVKIKQKTTGTTDTFKVRVKGGLFVLYDADNNGIDPAVEDGVSRTWVIEEAVKGGSQARVTLQFSADNKPKDWAPSFRIEKAVMAQYTESWAAPTTGSATLDPNNSSLREVSLDHLSSFRIFGVFNYDHQRLTTLPVELVSFKATRVKGEVELKWLTAMEKNNDYFTLEQSADGKNFKEVTQVKGAGNTNQQINYNYLHKNAPAQATYYRLKQTDFDGTFTYSKVISVTGITQLSNITVYPNPGNGPFTLQGAANFNEGVILDATGRIIKKLATLERTITFDLSDQQAGIYFLHLKGATETQTLRLIKK